MSRPKFVQARRTTLKVGISSAETTEIILTELLDLYGNALAMSNFADAIYLTFNPGSTNEEIVSATDFTVNSDGSVSIDTGITRGLAGVSAYASGGTARAHAAGTVVVVSNNPQIYEAILDYIDGLAIAGAADASLTGKGIVEVATSAEIDSDEDFGSTGAYVVTSPDQLALSKYGTRLPSTAGKSFLDSVVGMIFPYTGNSAPSGFNLCDGSTLTLATYPVLGGILLGRYGYGTAVTFTADAGTDVCTSTSHGLTDTQRVLLKSTTTLPAGLSENTIYYVRDATTNTFKLSTSSGGSAIDITDAGTGTHSFYVSYKVPDLRSRFPLGYSASAPTKIFTFASRSSDTITVTGSDNHANNELQTGQAVLYSAPSGAITGLVHNTTYYLVRVAYNQFKLASSLANANEGTTISLSSDGTGTQTFTITYTVRPLGQSGGEENHAISDNQMPSHRHDTYSSANNAVSVNNITFTNDTNGTNGRAGTTPPILFPEGADEMINEMPLFTVVNYVIKTD